MVNHMTASEAFKLLCPVVSDGGTAVKCVSSRCHFWSVYPTRRGWTQAPAHVWADLVPTTEEARRTFDWEGFPEPEAAREARPQFSVKKTWRWAFDDENGLYGWQEPDEEWSARWLGTCSYLEAIQDLREMRETLSLLLERCTERSR